MAALLHAVVLESAASGRRPGFRLCPTPRCDNRIVRIATASSTAFGTERMHQVRVTDMCW